MDIFIHLYLIIAYYSYHTCTYMGQSLGGPPPPPWYGPRPRPQDYTLFAAFGSSQALTACYLKFAAFGRSQALFGRYII